MSREDMEKCPFCGGHDCYMKKEAMGSASVRCPDCGLMATFGDKAAGAALKAGRMPEFVKDRWNTRAGE